MSELEEVAVRTWEGVQLLVAEGDLRSRLAAAFEDAALFVITRQPNDIPDALEHRIETLRLQLARTVELSAEDLHDAANEFLHVAYELRHQADLGS